MEFEEWQQDAACLELPTDWFFDPPMYTDIIRVYCDKCPVKELCLERGLWSDELNGRRDGLWGGMSEITRSRRYGRIHE